RLSCCSRTMRSAVAAESRLPVGSAASTTCRAPASARGLPPRGRAPHRRAAAPPPRAPPPRQRGGAGPNPLAEPDPLQRQAGQPAPLRAGQAAVQQGGGDGVERAESRRPEDALRDESQP